MPLDLPRRLRRPLLFPLLALALLALVGLGCHGSERELVLWPQVDVLPTAPPADLDRSAGGSVLRRGSDGFLYVVGGVDKGAEPGAIFFARYSGRWPLEDLPRPPLAVGQVLRRFDGEVALAQLLYQVPDAEVEGLEISWGGDDLQQERVGKGFAHVRGLSPGGRADVEMSIGELAGVRPGDIYGILRERPASGPDGEPDLAGQGPGARQIGRTLVNICLVSEVQEEEAHCRLWRPSELHPLRRGPAPGDEMVFLEHNYGKPPQRARIHVAQVKGGNPELQALLVNAMQAYARSHLASGVEVAPLGRTVPATDRDFHRHEEAVEAAEGAQLLLGAEVVERDGEPHLVVNYTGVGAPTGPGMIAAPPVGGVDLGPVEALEVGSLEALMGTLYGAVLVYRGQTSEALVHLRQLLEDPALRGPLRWHVRDQYAMRLAVLGYHSEALWTVLEDEALARGDQDREAELNALGTRVRLYDFLERPVQASRAAREYLELRRTVGGPAADATMMSAVAMYAEMLLGAGETDQARRQIQALQALCPEEGAPCRQDLYGLLQSVYWALPPETDEALREGMLAQILEVGQEIPTVERAGLRMLQGLAMLWKGEEDLTQALIAFKEAQRLYLAEENLPGVARALYFEMLTQLRREEWVPALEAGQQAARLYREKLQDFAGEAQVHERMSTIFARAAPQELGMAALRAAPQVLSRAVELQLAAGAWGKVAEALFTRGSFLLKLGQPEADDFRHAVAFALPVTRFDLAALSHLSLAVVARAQGDLQTFRDELLRAKLMAELSGDPQVMQLLKDALTPPQPEEDPGVDTQLL